MAPMETLPAEILVKILKMAVAGSIELAPLIDAKKLINSVLH